MTDYASLLVHEQLAVVLDQLENARTWAPSLIFIIHVSPAASFTPDELRCELDARNVNAIVNENQVQTVWSGGTDRARSDLLSAHLSNLRIALGNGGERLSFHSSNDLFVRPLKPAKSDLVSRRHDIAIEPDHGWAWRNEVLGDQYLKSVVGSSTGLRRGQIEGSTYPLGWLGSALGPLTAMSAAAAYPREEVIFPTLARIDGLPISATPYVFSEVHRTDFGASIAAPLVRVSMTGPGSVLRAPARFFRSLAMRLAYRSVDMRDVTRIRTESLPRRDLGVLWHAEAERYQSEGLCAVKRIPRDLDHPIRAYIRNLPFQ